MPLVPEDGTGLATANAYADLDFAEAYFELRPNAAWSAATDEVKEGGLVVGAAWLDAQFGSLFLSGALVQETQALHFPLDDMELSPAGRDYSGTVPRILKEANCEAAVAHVQASLSSSIDLGGGIDSAKLGPMGVKFRSIAKLRSTQFISGLVADLLGTSRGAVRVVRA